MERRVRPVAECVEVQDGIALLPDEQDLGTAAGGGPGLGHRIEKLPCVDLHDDHGERARCGGGVRCWVAGEQGRNHLADGRRSAGVEVEIGEHRLTRAEGQSDCIDHGRRQRGRLSRQAEAHLSGRIQEQNVAVVVVVQQRPELRQNARGGLRPGLSQPPLHCFGDRGALREYRGIAPSLGPPLDDFVHLKPGDAREARLGVSPNLLLLRAVVPGSTAGQGEEERSRGGDQPAGKGVHELRLVPGAQFGVGVAQPQGERARQLAEHPGRDRGPAPGRRFEIGPRDHEQVDGRRGHRVGRTLAPIQERHLAEEIAPPD